MRTLGEAWRWYESATRSIGWMQRLGRKHWSGIPWESSSIGRDADLNTLDEPDIESATSDALAPIHDLAVAVLFSVFESLMREHVLGGMQAEAGALTDPILKDAAEDAMRGVDEGSFYRRVLEPLRLQGKLPADLVTEVNQVRQYRNWVSHGRRGIPANNVTPGMARERLQACLQALGVP
ncbi:MAG: hypothetical protein K2W96_13560 [Gemmataceae bacterium]|nr:hypothetical protein [Gemmataceae bacterium]